jgi:hypothetical protein
MHGMDEPAVMYMTVSAGDPQPTNAEETSWISQKGGFRQDYFPLGRSKQAYAASRR